MPIESNILIHHNLMNHFKDLIINTANRELPTYLGPINYHHGIIKDGSQQNPFHPSIEYSDLYAPHLGHTMQQYLLTWEAILVDDEITQWHHIVTNYNFNHMATLLITLVQLYYTTYWGPILQQQCAHEWEPSEPCVNQTLREYMYQAATFETKLMQILNERTAAK